MDWLIFVIVGVLAIVMIGIAVHRIRRPLDIDFDMQDRIKAAQMEMLKPTESAAEWLKDLNVDPFSIEMKFVPNGDNIFTLLSSKVSEDKEIDLSIDCGPYCMLGKTELASVEIGDDGEGNSTLVVSTKRSNWRKVKKSWLKRLHWHLSKALRTVWDVLLKRVT